MNEHAKRKQATEKATCLAGFEHVQRYWDRDFQLLGAKILPGEYFVSMSGEPIATLLGSCVSVCLRDRIFGIGGMNHIMLPESAGNGPIDDAHRYGSFAMEALINTILANGGRKNNFEFKVFGGGAIMGKMSDIGQQNIDFVMEYLALEGFDVIASDVGGDQPRKVIYIPDVGRVRVRRLAAVEQVYVAEEEKTARQDVCNSHPTGDIELFD